jgi:hypothetical protein
MTTKMLVGQVVLACLLMVTGCAEGSRRGNGLGFAAQAASGFSNSTLTGSYAFSGQSTGFAAQGSKKVALVGFVTLDGKGNIASGSTTEASEQAASVCTFSLSGTYSVSANGTGSATMIASNTTGSCVDETNTFALALSGGGNQINLVETTLGNGAIASSVLYRQ